jgi:hypothetical protein
MIFLNAARAAITHSIAEEGKNHFKIEQQLQHQYTFLCEFWSA